eukprot:3379107-Amphidinium_carterae.1
MLSVLTLCCLPGPRAEEEVPDAIGSEWLCFLAQAGFFQITIPQSSVGQDIFPEVIPGLLGIKLVVATGLDNFSAFLIKRPPSAVHQLRSAHNISQIYSCPVRWMAHGVVLDERSVSLKMTKCHGNKHYHRSFEDINESQASKLEGPGSS